MTFPIATTTNTATAGSTAAANTLRLQPYGELTVAQKREFGELFGYESRNKFEISANGGPIAYAAEQGKGFGAIVLRQFLGHWRTFEIHIFDANRQLQFRAVHPFRFYFRRLEVSTVAGRPLGTVERRFSIFSKCFDVTTTSGETLTVRSPIWKLWTFEFKKGDQTQASVLKKWGGIFKEALLDADTFRVVYSNPSMSEDMRALILASSIFIDLMYFEKKAE